MSSRAEVAASIRRYVLVASGVAAMRKRDFLLAGFPRSGTTWTRHVLCNVISLQEWQGRDVEPVLNDTMPALGANDLFRRWPHASLPRVIKTHHRYSPAFGRPTAISVIRDPRDVMVSRYHLIRDKRDESRQPFDRFIRDRRHGLESWFKHFTSWRPHSTLVLRYEDMLSDPHHEFGRLLEALGARVDDAVLHEAIERSSFPSLQAAERRRAPTATGNRLFFRSGSSGQWREYFEDTDQAYFREVARRYDVEAYR